MVCRPIDESLDHRAVSGVPRPASTLCLVRDTPQGIEVLMVRRSPEALEKAKGEITLPRRPGLGPESPEGAPRRPFALAGEAGRVAVHFPPASTVAG